MSKRVVVLDYGSGNLRSAERALALVGADVTVTADTEAAGDCDALVVPGVGAFAACLEGIVAIGADEVIRSRVAAERPVLGICVGMQVLFDRGEEHGVVSEGLGVLRGQVSRLQATVIPHMGWNTVSAAAGSRLFDGVEDERFYFVHSYAATPTGRDGETISRHDEPFVAAVEQGVVAATQFHPEKSGPAGQKLLRNWLTSLS